jgi:hypothetical protein
MNNNFDDPGKPRRSAGKNSSSDLIWNVLTGVMLLGTLCLVGVFASLLTDPHSQLNPFPPPTATPTPIPLTSTPLSLAATWTPTVTIEPTITNTPRPTFTLEPSATLFTLASPTSALTPTKTAKPTGVPYTAKIEYYDSTTFRPDTSCDVMLVAGQTLDSGNNPVTGLIITLGGSVPGKVFNPPLTTLAGIAKDYGPSGFEFNPGIAPVASNNSLWVQLSVQGGAALSNQIFLTTFKDCKKNNLIYIRFQQK